MRQVILDFTCDPPRGRVVDSGQVIAGGAIDGEGRIGGVEFPNIGVATVNVDGACSGNPGPASVAAVLSIGEQIVDSDSKQIGRATNNEAEYQAVLFGLRLAWLNGYHSNVRVLTDSRLAASQIRGEFHCHDLRMIELRNQVRGAMAHFEKSEIKWIPREQNAEADELANKALRKHAA